MPIPSHLLPDTSAVSPDGHLTLGGLDVLDIASEFGTPVFIYDEQHLRNRLREALAAFGPGVAYAGKAFLCTAMAQLVQEEGLHLDVATGGELHIALHAGVDPDRIVLHGNNKSPGEISEALGAGVGRIVVDSFDEMDRIDQLVRNLDVAAPNVLIRVTPGVKAETHEFISTGQDDSKFGFTVSNGTAARAVQRAQASSSMNLVGIHSHIGSQVMAIDSFAKAFETLAAFSQSYDFEEISIGGGLAVPYVEGESAPTITAWGATVRGAAESLGLNARITAEPGRSIAAGAAITVYTVGTVKDIPGVRRYVAVDGGFGDNPRPVLYGSDYTTFMPRAVEAPRPDIARLVGKHCESGDIIVREARVPNDLVVGDLIATPVTGAYGRTMGSNYNHVLRPPVVFVADGDARLVMRRENYDDLTRLEV